MFHLSATPPHFERRSSAIRGRSGSGTVTESGRINDKDGVTSEYRYYPHPQLLDPLWSSYFERGRLPGDINDRVDCHSHTLSLSHHGWEDPRSRSEYGSPRYLSPVHPQLASETGTGAAYVPENCNTMIADPEAAPALSLRPNSLYIVISARNTEADRGQADIATDQPAAVKSRPVSNPGTGSSLAEPENLKWGLYWCQSRGKGRSYRYCYRGPLWKFEQKHHPLTGGGNTVVLEENPNVIAALHIENMDEDMANLLGERLAPEMFPHSQSERRRSRTMSEGDAGRERLKPTAQELENRGEPTDNKSRRWVGHALMRLNNLGFISLKEGSLSAALIEKEASAQAETNVSSWPWKRTVERSGHVIFDTKAQSMSDS